MKTLNIILVLLAVIIHTSAQQIWVPDKNHSRIGFSVTHLMISEVEGNFKEFSGTIKASKADFTDAVIDFSVDVASINTDNTARDNHLKADDFFNAPAYPKMTFKSTSFKKMGGNNYLLEGNLQIRDVTKKVKFDVIYSGTVKDPYGNTKAGFKATSTINRFDYGLRWNVLTEAGGMMVGQDVKIILNLQFNLQN